MKLGIKKSKPFPGSREILEVWRLGALLFFSVLSSEVDQENLHNELLDKNLAFLLFSPKLHNLGDHKDGANFLNGNSVALNIHFWLSVKT